MTHVPDDLAHNRLTLLIEALRPFDPLVIVDVGANPRGEVPGYAGLMAAGAAKVWGFEPNAEAFAALEARNDPARVALPHAVGRPGRHTFYSHSISTLSSLYPFRRAAARFLGKPHWLRRKVEEIPMDLVTLDTLDEIPAIDFLKMDAQGAELDVARGGLSKLSETAVVIPEVAFYQIYEGQPMQGDVDAELRRQGFVLHKYLFQKGTLLPSSQARRLHGRRARSQLIDGDAVYIRSMDDPGKVTDRTMLAMAILADAVVGSPDLCLMCLDHLVARGLAPDDLPAAYVDLLPAQLLADEPVEA